MASLGDVPELVGFFSYSREDDADSHGGLSALRTRIQGELRGQLGRTAKTFRLWQDKEAIPSGTLWETEIKNAVGQAAFFIPIITPTVVASPHCRFELESFLARETELGRGDLVFPILYIEVPALEDAARRQNDPVLSLIARRQYVDWSEFRYLDVDSTEVRRAVGRFCADIRDALNRTWISPEERKQQQETALLARAEIDRQQREAEVKRRADEEARRATAEEERRQREAEAERRRAQAERQKAEQRRGRADADANLRRGAEAGRSGVPSWQKVQKSRLVLILGSIVGVAVIVAAGAWFAAPATHPPVTPPAVIPAPVPPPRTVPPEPFPPPPPVAPPSVKPAPAATIAVPGVSVPLGATIDRVRAAYSIQGDPTNGCGSSSPCIELTASNGLRFFFDDNKLLNEVRADAPFSGSIEGVRIGDSLHGVESKYGKPYTTFDYSPNTANLFRVNNVTLRCDVNNAGNVATIFVWLK